MYLLSMYKADSCSGSPHQQVRRHRRIRGKGAGPGTKVIKVTTEQQQQIITAGVRVVALPAKDSTTICLATLSRQQVMALR